MISRRWETRRDHPRSRGVYRIICQSRAQTGGSSPLARGLPHADEPVRHRPGIIPARAGFTYRGHRDARSIPGSSPLARGLPTGAARCRAGGGIIPARAGFTWGRGARAMRGRDHPRSRGVYSMWRYSRGEAEGSSPLARGLRSEAGSWCYGRGIIPARAGFTPATGGTSTSTSGSSPLARGLPTESSSRSESCRDHPRSRGVYRRKVRAGRISAGSSPLARGLPAHTPSRSTLMRIIPARAGFTGGRLLGVAAPGDHPRSRGVYIAYVPRGRRVGGSSPLARGLPAYAGQGRFHRRIIPARAGFTCGSSSGRSPMRDHPRSRGVYRLIVYRPLSDLGSSPLARGLHIPGYPHRHHGQDHPRSRGVYGS